MKTKLRYIAIAIAFAGAQQAFAQKKDENIGTEVVNVVKPYTPTISDAFKVKETPVIEDEQEKQKEEIKYNIFSFPVASTFAPDKGKAATVDKEAREKYYNNYATLGIGNYGTINAELFVTENVSDTDYMGGMLRHLSSQGGIDAAKVDDNYYNTALDLTYGSRQQGYNWSTDLGYQNQVYNWYGLPLEFTDIAPETIAEVDPQQTYHTFYIGGKIQTKDSYFHDASAQYKRFWDAYGSAENRFFLTPSLDIPIMDEKIKVDLVADYVGGTFEKDINDMGDMSYSHFNLGIQPSLLYQKEDLSVQLGAGIFYSMGKMNEETDNKIFVYPQVKASYKVVGDLMVAYAGAEGTLRQNSYADFVSQNPFVSPTLAVAPTDQQYDIYVGLKGKLASTVAYNIRGSYMNEDNRAFFVNNALLTSLGDDEGYSYGNSFGLVYDRLQTISFFGELKADFSQKIHFGINGTYYSYSTDDLEEAFNMPQMKVGASLDVDIMPKWYAGTNIFFTGERKDVVMVTSGDLETVTLESFFDLNAHLGYKYNERLTGFLKLNNITGQDYQRWVNYPVQGFQFLIGASYKFNF
ncbi:TonB-dependent receptor [Flavobacterium sp.]|uniref:TonB-dependent receptor n=1 Tax=Flavobacterium sp. TaxID=239 RepID=UPI004033F085